MKPSRHALWTLGLSLLVSMFPAKAAIESDFDDQVYPGEAGNGWVTPWQHPPDATPQILTEDAVDGGTPYVRLDTPGTTGRNLMRQYESGGDVDINQPHIIRWKFRLVDADFAASFASFNDRVHFFGRSAPRLTASTDASVSWAILAAGAAHGSGAAAGQTFWIYDNVSGDSAFTAENHVDSGIALLPDHVYAFEVLLDPANQTYSVSIVDETDSVSFESAAAHRFRDLSATTTSHNLAHFGVNASASDLNRGFDLDTVSITEAPLSEVPPQIVNVIPEPNAFHDAAEGLQFEALSAEDIPVEGITLVLNGADVSGDLVITGEPTARTVRYEGLVADEIYTAEITVVNTLGTSTLTFQFNTSLGRTTLFDSGGFEDAAVYPEGALQAVTDGGGTWGPGGEPAQIVDLADGDFGKVLRREQTGNDNTDILTFAGASVGILTIEFDALASITTARTLDVMLLPASGGQMASMLGWGINAGQVAYFDGSAWVSAQELDTGWHRFEMINYLSGPLARTWDFVVDGVVVERGLPWRHEIAEGTTLSRLRLGGIRGPAGEYADIDNLAIYVEPEAAPPPVIANILPAHRTHFHAAGEGLSFEATSDEPIPTDGFTLVLNGTDVSDQLTIGGDPTSRTIQYGGLEPDVIYTAEITVANVLGENGITVQFDTISQDTAIVDVDGFEDTSRYPAGDLGAVTEDYGVWTPGRTGTPAQIATDPEQGGVLRRAQTGDPNIDILDFPPFTQGVIVIEFNARVSTTGGRTLDVALNRTGQDQRAGSLAWGAVPGRLAYEQGGVWNDFADIDDQWHHYELVNYLDGPQAQTFDVWIDGERVADALPWNGNFSAANAVFGRMRIGAEGGLAGDSADVDDLIIRVAPPPPAILGFVPAALEVFHPAGSGLQFQVGSAAELPPGAIQVILNGVDVSDELEITGEPPLFTITYNGLQAQTFYTAEITVMGATGTSVLTHQFATFEPSNVVTIEGEDYNYNSGEFQDDPPPSGFRPDGTQVNGNGVGYADLTGTLDVDYSIGLSPGGDPLEIYRFLDNVGTRYSSDAVRQKYVDAQVPDYEVWGFVSGDWLNYTRTFAPGTYQVFLRASSPAEQTLSLDLVTSDPTVSGQSTEPLGVFEIPATVADYTYVPLTTTEGGLQTVDFDGVETIRLTGTEADSGVTFNFMLFLSAPVLPDEIVILDPAITPEGFSFSFGTETGREYTVEYTEDLTPGVWTTLGTVSGSGDVEPVMDDAAGEGQRFYRVGAD